MLSLSSLLAFAAPKTMWMKKVHSWFLIVLILIFVVSLSFVQCSSSSRIYRTNMAGSRSITTSIMVKAEEVATRFGNIEAPSSVGTVEDSARKVPTGPDPLHHNNNPLDP